MVTMDVKGTMAVGTISAPNRALIIEKILDLAGMYLQSTKEDDDRVYSIEEVFPDFHIGHVLRGLRSREGLTQKQLGEKIGARPTHISEMENGKRPIGKGMAKRLAKALW